MTPEERAEIMAEVPAATWATIRVHVTGPSPGMAAPIGLLICTGAHIDTGAAAPVPIPWRQIP